MKYRLATLLLLSFSCYAFADDACDTDKDGIISGSEQYLCSYSEHKKSVRSDNTILPFFSTGQQTVTPTPSQQQRVTVVRDANGKIHRSESAKNDFKRQHPCPANGHTSGSCQGYVIDHINPLACGGADDPSNMQWQTVSAGKAKDKTERDNCQQPKTANSQPAQRTHKRTYKSNSGYGASNNSGSGKVYTGSRGGRYTITSSGHKHYIKR